MKKYSNNFKKLFLLHFTKELILNSASNEVIRLQITMNEQAKKKKEKIIRSVKRNIPKNKEEIIRSIKKNIPKHEAKVKEQISDFSKIFKRIKPKFYSQKRILTIPEPKLPAHLQYLKPVPRKIEIDLEKLNPLIKDPAVKVIECNGPFEHIIVRGSMGVKPTNIVLTEEEINRTIRKFSAISKIPIHEGVYRVVTGRFILSAIISEVVSSKFMIKKMFYAPNLGNQTSPQTRIR